MIADRWPVKLWWNVEADNRGGGDGWKGIEKAAKRKKELSFLGSFVESEQLRMGRGRPDRMLSGYGHAAGDQAVRGGYEFYGCCESRHRGRKISSARSRSDIFKAGAGVARAIVAAGVEVPLKLLTKRLSACLCGIATSTRSAGAADLFFFQKAVLVCLLVQNRKHP